MGNVSNHWRGYPVIDPVTPPYKHIVNGCMVSLLILTILGTVGNLLSAVTLLTPGLRHQATSVCLVALAASDTLVLLTSVFRFRAFYPFLSEEQYLESKYLVDDYLDVYVEPFHWMALGVTSFITTMVTAERFLAIRFPFWVRRHCSLRRHAAALAVVVLIPVALTLPNFFYYRVEERLFLNRSVTVAVVTEFGSRDRYRCVYLTYLIPILWYVLPWFCLAILNALLVRHVRLSARVSHRAGVTPGRTGHAPGTVHRVVAAPVPPRPGRGLTVLLVVLVLTHMVCNLPKCVTVFIRLVQESSQDLCQPGSQRIQEFPRTTQEAAEWVVSVFNVANSAVNFLLYCGLGHKFRVEFTRLFCPCCACARPGEPAPSYTGKASAGTHTLGHSAI